MCRCAHAHERLEEGSKVLNKAIASHSALPPIGALVVSIGSAPGW